MQQQKNKNGTQTTHNVQILALIHILIPNENYKQVYGRTTEGNK